MKSGETFTVYDKQKCTFTDLVVDGTVIFQGEDMSTAGWYTGALYVQKTEATATSGEKYTSTITTIAAALEKIDVANEKTVYIRADKIDMNIDVLAGQTVKISAVGQGEDLPVVKSDAVVTVRDEATVTGIGKVEGAVIVSPEGDAQVGSYDSIKTAEDGTVTYAGFAYAIGQAQPGDVIEIENAEIGTDSIRESLTIPTGVTVKVTESMTINGDLNIPDGATLVGGNITVNSTESNNVKTDSKVTVAGKLDLSEGSINGTFATLTSTGETVLSSSPAGITGASGAYYVNADGDCILTSVTKAVSAATEGDVSEVNIMGTVNDSSDITLDGVNLKLSDGAKVTLGNVTLKDAKITATGAELSATVSALSGTDASTGASDGVLVVKKSAVVLESKTTVSAAGVTTYTYTFDSISGEMTVSAGTVSTGKAITSSANGSKFTVASGAVLAVVNDMTVDGKDVEFIVNGTVAVGNTTPVTLAFTNADATDGKVPVIAGDLNIGKNATVNATALSVTGQVDVSATETDNAAFNVNDNITVGTPAKTLGADASVVGKVTLADGKFIKTYAGADMSGALINVTAGESAAKVAEFFVNDVLYATVYAMGDVAISDAVPYTELNKIDGVVDFDNDKNKLVWKDIEGEEVTGNITDDSQLYTKMDASKVTIQLSVSKGVSLWIDNVNSSKTAVLTVGEHTVSATVDPGYKGDVVITFNGQTVTNGKIVITSDMDGKNILLAATGEISIDNGSSSGSSSSNSDDGMGITDYLLIVLVVLAAILVVIVALRMMRS